LPGELGGAELEKKLVCLQTTHNFSTNMNVISKKSLIHSQNMKWHPIKS